MVSPQHVSHAINRSQAKRYVLINTPPPQAPTAPTKRRSIRAKALERLANPLLPRKTHRPSSAVTDAFLETKRDRRLIKHSSFVSRISKAQPAPHRKRRRPSKKLVTTLDGLADALPELTAEEERGAGGDAAGGGKVRHRSLRSRPGALKRKERVVRGEMERFGVSLAQLTATREEPVAQKQLLQQTPAREESGMDVEDGVAAAPAPAKSTSNRWAALRGFISATMEQNPAFASKG